MSLQNSYYLYSLYLYQMMKAIKHGVETLTKRKRKLWKDMQNFTNQVLMCLKRLKIGINLVINDLIIYSNYWAIWLKLNNSFPFPISTLPLSPLKKCEKKLHPENGNLEITDCYQQTFLEVHDKRFSVYSNIQFKWNFFSETFKRMTYSESFSIC